MLALMYDNDYPNSMPSGTITLDTALNPDTIRFWEIHLYNRTSSASAMLRYVWRFFTDASDLGEPYEDDPDYTASPSDDTPSNESGNNTTSNNSTSSSGGGCNTGLAMKKR